MIQPTIGRIVLYWPHATDDVESLPGQPHAATIVGVHSDREVNLSVHDAVGSHYRKRNVLLLQDGDSRPEAGGICEWMPYQKGQAAKTDAAEAAAKAAAEAAGKTAPPPQATPALGQAEPAPAAQPAPAPAQQ